jgi:hypothetical protein
MLQFEGNPPMNPCLRAPGRQKSIENIGVIRALPVENAFEKMFKKTSKKN